jgi:hypothetical protein
MAIFPRSCSFAAERLISGLILAMYAVSVSGFEGGEVIFEVIWQCDI